MANREETIDWDELHAEAVRAAQRGYAPYSQYLVGAAALVDDGRVVTGCNVENASYGLGLCAECGVVSDLHRSGGGRLVAAVATGPTGRKLMPCGRCRQLLVEAGGPGLLVDTETGPRPLRDLLPDAFTSADLTRPD